MDDKITRNAVSTEVHIKEEPSSNIESAQSSGEHIFEESEFEGIPIGHVKIENQEDGEFDDFNGSPVDIKVVNVGFMDSHDEPFSSQIEEESNTELEKLGNTEVYIKQEPFEIIGSAHSPGSSEYEVIPVGQFEFEKQGKEHCKKKLSKKRQTDIVSKSTYKRTRVYVPVPCHFCKKILSDKRKLKNHIANWHTEEKRFKCDVCDKEFGTVIGLKSHTNLHNTKNTFICCNCGQVFATMRSLNNHKNRNVCLTPVSCSNCENYFKNLKEKIIAADQETKHSELGTCQFCSRHFVDAVLLKSHENHHVNRERSTCDKCGDVVANPIDNINLINCNDNAKILKSFLCDVCGKILSHRSQTDHMSMHAMENSTVMFNCDKCEKSFQSKRNLKVHNKIHVAERTHECKECGKAFKFPRALVRHIRTHIQNMNTDSPNNKPLLYGCQLCEKRFSQKVSLESHLNVHKGIRPYVCTDPGCDKTFTSKSTYSKHKMFHTGIRRHQCETCGKAFKTTEHLKVHNRIHTGEKPFSCSICGRCFIERTTRDRHETKIHKNDVKK